MFFLMSLGDAVIGATSSRRRGCAHHDSGVPGQPKTTRRTSKRGTTGTKLAKTSTRRKGSTARQHATLPKASPRIETNSTSWGHDAAAGRAAGGVVHQRAGDAPGEMGIGQL